VVDAAAATIAVSIRGSSPRWNACGISSLAASLNGSVFKETCARYRWNVPRNVIRRDILPGTHDRASDNSKIKGARKEERGEFNADCPFRESCCAFRNACRNAILSRRRRGGNAGFIVGQECADKRVSNERNRRDPLILFFANLVTLPALLEKGDETRALKHRARLCARVPSERLSELREFSYCAQRNKRETLSSLSYIYHVFIAWNLWIYPSRACARQTVKQLKSNIRE